jgi:hypothetical protein
VLGADEEQRAARAGGDLGGDVDLRVALHRVHAVVHRRDGRVGAGDGVHGRVDEVLADQLVDAAVEVAENSSRWVPSAVMSSSAVTAGMKPRSAMWSASSSTVICSASSVHSRWSMRSCSRPGVATTTSTPRRSWSIWRPIEAPP